MTDRVDLPIEEIPGEMYPLIRAYQPSLKSKQEEYLPIVYVNELSQRTRDLVRFKPKQTFLKINQALYIICSCHLKMASSSSLFTRKQAKISNGEPSIFLLQIFLLHKL